MTEYSDSVKDLSQITAIYEGFNLMKGFKPKSVLDVADEESKDAESPQTKVITVPANFFKGIEVVTKETEALFEFVATFVTTQLIERLEDDKWALQFPDTIDNEGRRVIHAVADYFELAHHSQGKAGKGRRAMIYPRTQFREKQETERRRMEKEIEKTREKFKEKNITVEPPLVCKTLRDQVIRQIWEEKNPIPAGQPKLSQNMLDKLIEGMEASGQQLILRLKPLIVKKKIELDASPFATLVKESSASVATPVALEETKVEDPLPKQKQNDSDEDSADEDIEVDVETIEQTLRRKIVKHQEADKLYEYQSKLKATTLKTFTDKPDEVNQLFLVKSTPQSITIEWEAPSSNNSNIVGYLMYLGDILVDECEGFRFTYWGLQPNTCYYFTVVANSSDQGEGYKSKRRFMGKTMKDTGCHELYVWGNNQNSETGLTDDLVKENIAYYHQKKCRMFKPVNHKMFGNMCFQAATGNVNSTFLGVDENEFSFLISCGITLVPIEETDQNEVAQDDLGSMQLFSSLPFVVEFNLPVVKVMCGDQFSGLLTAEGQVYTWGQNTCGQLGIKNENIVAVRRPARVGFEGSLIQDIACGYNHCLALSDRGELFVWGSLMGVYPNVELTLNYLKSHMNLLSIEINQSFPRMIKNNLIFYKIRQLVCGPYNSALVTQDGELMVQGINEHGQLAMGKELGQIVNFFPEFRKIDPFGSKNPVVGVAIGATSMHIITEKKMYAVGDNTFGQFGDGNTLSSFDLVEIPCISTFKQISAGAWHVLALDTQGAVYGWGKCNSGQLGFRPTLGIKIQSSPVKIEFETEVKQVQCGSLFSMALV